MFLWLKTLYRKRAVTWPFIFYTIIWTLSDFFHETLLIYLIICIFLKHLPFALEKCVSYNLQLIVFTF
ncbi:hypothetical protein DRJ91_10915 [Enterococcus faecalis]|nr:hypothetical protein DRJ91_10915 [Enterococcus faecalis]